MRNVNPKRQAFIYMDRYMDRQPESESDNRQAKTNCEPDRKMDRRGTGFVCLY